MREKRRPVTIGSHFQTIARAQNALESLSKSRETMHQRLAESKLLRAMIKRQIAEAKLLIGRKRPM